MVAADLANLDQGRPEKVLIKTFKIKEAAKKLKVGQLAHPQLRTPLK